MDSRCLSLHVDRAELQAPTLASTREVLKDARSQPMRAPGSASPIAVRHVGGRLVTADGLRLATSINDLPEAEYFALVEEARG
jgi:hypothetical protein